MESVREVTSWPALQAGEHRVVEAAPAIEFGQAAHTTVGTAGDANAAAYNASPGRGGASDAVVSIDGVGLDGGAAADEDTEAAETESLVGR
jgi:hypothetical protein